MASPGLLSWVRSAHRAFDPLTGGLGASGSREPSYSDVQRAGVRVFVLGQLAVYTATAGDGLTATQLIAQRVNRERQFADSSVWGRYQCTWMGNIADVRTTSAFLHLAPPIRGLLRIPHAQPENFLSGDGRAPAARPHTLSGLVRGFAPRLQLRRLKKGLLAHQ